MVRIFSVLAVLAVLLLAANFLVGLWIGDFNAAAQQKRAAQRRVIDLERQGRGGGAAASTQLEEARQALKEADAAFHTPRQRMTLHMLLGATAALVAVLVNSITITYFIGTSRWCREVCETYGIRGELAEQSTQLKRSTFPWAVAAVLTIILLVGLGAAADPSGANAARSASFVTPHYLMAMIGLVVVIAAFGVQISRIAENYGVIEQILAEVQRARGEQGTPLEAGSRRVSAVN